jgi:hypothetical protein
MKGIHWITHFTYIFDFQMLILLGVIIHPHHEQTQVFVLMTSGQKLENKTKINVALNLKHVKCQETVETGQKIKVQ